MSTTTKSATTIISNNNNNNQKKTQQQAQQQTKDKQDNSLSSSSSSSSSLASWVKTQRSNYNRGTLSHERIALLNEIQFCWNIYEWSYRNKVSQIMAAQQQQQLDYHDDNHHHHHHHENTTYTAPITTTSTTSSSSPIHNKKMNRNTTNYPKSILDWKITDGPLGLWMCRQRTNYRKYCQERIRLVVLQQQQQQQKSHDDDDDDNDDNLCHQIMTNSNITATLSSIMPLYQVELLETKLGFHPNLFIINTTSISTTDSSTSTISFSTKHNNNNKTTTTTRTKRTRTTSSNPPVYISWNVRIQQLHEFRQEHGHVNVPRTYNTPHHVNLGTWVSKVRERYRYHYYHYKNYNNDHDDNHNDHNDHNHDDDHDNDNTRRTILMSSSSSSTTKKKQQQLQVRIQDLMNLEFIWDVCEYRWQQQFLQLIQFYETHGHVHVPDSYPTLGPWVKEQRHEYQKLIRMGRRTKRTRTNTYNNRNGDNNIGALDDDDDVVVVVVDDEVSKLTPNHAMALNRIGIDWNRKRTVQEHQEEIFLQRIQQYKNYTILQQMRQKQQQKNHKKGNNNNKQQQQQPQNHSQPSATGACATAIAIQDEKDEHDVSWNTTNIISQQKYQYWIDRQRVLYRKWLQGIYDMPEHRRILLEDAGIVHGILE